MGVLHCPSARLAYRTYATKLADSACRAAGVTLLVTEGRFRLLVQHGCTGRIEAADPAAAGVTAALHLQ
jgi:hypothetical protein